MPVVAMANPTDVFAMDDLRSIMGRNFKPVVATRSQIETFLRIVRDSSKEVAALAQDAADSTGGQAEELRNLQVVVEDAPIVRYVNLLILQALNERASDIHIEPTPHALRIRFRIDGVMHDTSSASPSIAQAVVSRLKVLGEMDIAEHRIPQEGRVSVSMSDRQIDLRLATLPSVYGETVVMRLLDKSRSLRTLPELGFAPDTLDRYAKAYHQPYGVIVVTGPTGAGKTTTLYATLAEILTSEKSVVTVEDPVEYQIDGVTQVQINPKAGLLFSTALRSILRSDPDIVLIGEVRDPDTAKIAMEAALSGHLVLTTLHTNTAAATPLRLTEMGVEPFLVTSAVGSVLTQRLARVLCSVCKEPYDASEKEFYAAGYADADLENYDISTLYRAIGCRTCAHTGYLSRAVLAEVMNVSEEIERMIIQQASIAEVERMACEQGMRTLRQDGLLKAIQGTTTLEEVLRVVV
jgi:type IV pilus assembly protein PilB